MGVALHLLSNNLSHGVPLSYESWKQAVLAWGLVGTLLCSVSVGKCWAAVGAAADNAEAESSMDEGDQDAMFGTGLAEV